LVAEIEVYGTARQGMLTRAAAPFAARARRRRYRLFVRAVGLRAGDRVLDVGCGSAGLRALDSEHDITGLDVRPQPRYAGGPERFVQGDALAMPVHWYYDRAALIRDYGVVRDYAAPKNPHADSILWRSEYTPLNERGDILHNQAKYWGQRGIHYHQFLRAGENTLNLQLANVLIGSLIAKHGYDADDYLQRYIEFMLTPGRHRDTYVEEYHRKFFTAFEIFPFSIRNVPSRVRPV